MLAELVISHHERAVVHVGDVYIKADVDGERLDREVAALELIDVPRPHILWHRRGAVSLLALSEVGGVPLASLGVPSRFSDSVWELAGLIARQVHEHPIPDALASPSEYRDEDLADLETWLLAQQVADPGLIREHADRARAVRDSAVNESLLHGDFQPAHLLVDDDAITGVIDWADAGVGDAHYDLAVLTAGHSEHLDAVVQGYGSVDADRISGYWSWRRLGSIRWMLEHGFDASGDIDALAAIAPR